MRAILPLLCTLAALAAGCGRPCPANRFCGVATWVTTGSDPIVEGTSVLLIAARSSDNERGAYADPEALALRPRPVGLQFDLRALRGRGTTIERATLLLSPHPHWSTAERSVRVAVHAAQSSASVNAELSPLSDYVNTATIPLAMRAPVRVDITRTVRGWWDGSLPSGSLALSADQEGLVVQSASAVELSERPRLEVVVR